jgi:HTH-type transcriptional regulator/antitoxin HigA
LLADALPAVIQTHAQNRRALALINELMSKKSLTPEESQLLGLLGQLSSDFERRAYSLERATPREILAALMTEHNMKRADLIPIFKTRSAISEVLSGKRAISKNQAKALAQRFALSVEAFL